MSDDELFDDIIGVKEDGIDGIDPFIEVLETKGDKDKEITKDTTPKDKPDTKPKNKGGRPKKERKKKFGQLVAKDKVIGPQAGPQTDFLASEADIILFGGGAGGGKTAALVLESMRNIGVENFGAVIFRRTSTQIRSQGGLLDETKSFYPLVGGQLKDSKLKWIFPSGAQIDLRYLEYEKDVLNYMGSQVALLAFDELTHFSKHTFFYMLSRNRSTCDVKPYVRATCNPDSTSWVAEFIEWWIGEDGYPIPERAGKIRYFRRFEDVMYWGDTKEELLATDSGYLSEKAELDKGKRRKFYKEHLQDLKDKYYNDYKSMTFIPSLVTDNKILLDKNPSYMANLKALPLVEKEQLLYGNWKIKSSAGKFFCKDWFKKVVNLPPMTKDSRIIRYWDFAATKPSKANRDPDWTVGVRMRKDKDDSNFYIDDIVMIRDNPGEVERLFLGTCMKDRQEINEECPEAGYAVRFEEEGGASGKAESYRIKRLLMGYDVNSVKSNRNKETRARALAVQSESGNIVIKEAPWNEKFLTTMHLFTDDASKHDDIVDASSGAFNCHTSDFIYPTVFGLDNSEEGDELDGEAKYREKVQKIEEDFLSCSDMLD